MHGRRATVRVQYWGPEAKMTEVEARVALIYASTDDCRPLTGRLKYRQWLTGSLQVDFQVVALASHASRQSSWNIWICSFKIYGKWSVQASKQTNIHTHVRNEVTLVWGSLRLAPITMGCVWTASKTFVQAWCLWKASREDAGACAPTVQGIAVVLAATFWIGMQLGHECLLYVYKG